MVGSVISVSGGGDARTCHAATGSKTCHKTPAGSNRKPTRTPHGCSVGAWRLYAETLDHLGGALPPSLEIPDEQLEHRVFCHAWTYWFWSRMPAPA